MAYFDFTVSSLRSNQNYNFQKRDFSNTQQDIFNKFNVFKKPSDFRTIQNRSKQNQIPKNYPKQNLMLKYRDQFQQFYKNDKIKVITEEQLKNNELSLEIQKEFHQPSPQLLKQNSKLKSLQENMQYEPFTYTKQSIKLEENQKQILDENKIGKESVNSSIVGSIIHQNPSMLAKTDKKVLKTKEEVQNYKEKISDLEEKEANIINDLYKTHFTRQISSKVKISEPTGLMMNYKVNKNVNLESLEPQYIQLCMDDMNKDLNRNKKIKDPEEPIIRIVRNARTAHTSPQVANKITDSQILNFEDKPWWVKIDQDKNLNVWLQQQPVLQAPVPKHEHKHQNRCQCGSTDLDLAVLQTKAFQHLLLQKPKVTMMVPDTVNQKKYKASFYPQFKLTEELEQAFDDNRKYRELMSMPSKAIYAKLARSLKKK